MGCGLAAGAGHARLALLIVAMLTCPAAAGGSLPDNDVLMKALVDELERSKTLSLDDLPRPYFIQYTVVDQVSFTIGGAYGGLVHTGRSRTRSLTSRVRVGSYALDNTNFGGRFGGGGRFGRLPIDDDYAALRHGIWQVTDTDYKQAVEMLTRKEAFLKEKTVEDRPDDFSDAPPLQLVEPSAEIAFDNDVWKENVRRLSARFGDHPEIQDSSVNFSAGAVNRYIVNTEGTRLRKADTGVFVQMYAEVQADDGMRLYDSLSYVGEQITELPPVADMLSDIDDMCRKLVALAKAPIPEEYTGPVLFEPVAAGKVFAALLGDAVCARPTPLGGGRRWSGSESFEKKIGRRILPRSFQIVDDPGPRTLDGHVLAGAYRYDDEAVKARRVNIVEDGVLKHLVAGRAPTKKVVHTTGHARSGGFGDAEAAVGCLYISDDNAVSADALKQALIDAARDEDLEFALRVASIQTGGFGSLGAPIYAYKVYVRDGHEELIRGMDFLPVEVRSLKRMIAAGSEREVYNALGRVGSSYIAPAVVFEELELTKIEQEWDKRPILKSPATRGVEDE
ncbi:MAG: metallopeptidase TldD-related protein [Phycisphaerae bacterium]